MKKTIIKAMILIMTMVALTGCGEALAYDDFWRKDSMAAAETTVAEVPVEETAMAVEKEEEYSHIIEVHGIEIKLKEYEGYKPFVIRFVDDYGPEATNNGDAFFRYKKNRNSDNYEPISLDEAKKKDLICDYEQINNEGILIMYVNEKKTDLSLMPLPRKDVLRLEFNGDIQTYSALWADAAWKKIGLGNRYLMIDISPDKDIKEDAFVCVKRVSFNRFFYGAMGSDVGKDYLFVNSVTNESYNVIE